MYRFVDYPIGELVFLDEDEDEPQRGRRVPPPPNRKVSQRSTEAPE